MITSEAELRQLYDLPSERALLKQQVDLDRYCLRFIAMSPLCILATGGASDALMDASPRGGPPGFVQVPDPQTLLIPDGSGNNRLDTLSNLVHDPRIGLLFMVPGFNETLRVNGKARLRDEPHYTALFATDTFRPKVVIEVQVCEAYLHCSKSLMRARLWEPQSQVPRQQLPSLNQMIHAQIGLPVPQETQAEMEERYRSQIAQEHRPPDIGIG